MSIETVSESKLENVKTTPLIETTQAGPDNSNVQKLNNDYKLSIPSQSQTSTLLPTGPNGQASFVHPKGQLPNISAPNYTPNLGGFNLSQTNTIPSNSEVISGQPQSSEAIITNEQVKGLEVKTGGFIDTLKSRLKGLNMPDKIANIFGNKIQESQRQSLTADQQESISKIEESAQIQSAQEAITQLTHNPKAKINWPKLLKTGALLTAAVLLTAGSMGAGPLMIAGITGGQMIVGSASITMAAAMQTALITKGVMLGGAGLASFAAFKRFTADNKPAQTTPESSQVSDPTVETTTTSPEAVSETPQTLEMKDLEIGAKVEAMGANGTKLNFEIRGKDDNKTLTLYDSNVDPSRREIVRVFKGNFISADIGLSKGVMSITNETENQIVAGQSIYDQLNPNNALYIDKITKITTPKELKPEDLETQTSVEDESSPAVAESSVSAETNEKIKSLNINSLQDGQIIKITGEFGNIKHLKVFKNDGLATVQNVYENGDSTKDTNSYSLGSIDTETTNAQLITANGIIRANKETPQKLDFYNPESNVQEFSLNIANVELLDVKSEESSNVAKSKVEIEAAVAEEGSVNSDQTQNEGKATESSANTIDLDGGDQISGLENQINAINQIQGDVKNRTDILNFDEMSEKKKKENHNQANFEHLVEILGKNSVISQEDRKKTFNGLVKEVFKSNPSRYSESTTAETKFNQIKADILNVLRTLKETAGKSYQPESWVAEGDAEAANQIVQTVGSILGEKLEEKVTSLQTQKSELEAIEAKKREEAQAKIDQTPHVEKVPEPSLNSSTTVNISTKDGSVDYIPDQTAQQEPSSVSSELPVTVPTMESHNEIISTQAVLDNLNQDNKTFFEVSGFVGVKPTKDTNGGINSGEGGRKLEFEKVNNIQDAAYLLFKNENGNYQMIPNIISYAYRSMRNLFKTDNSDIFSNYNEGKNLQSPATLEVSNGDTWKLTKAGSY